MYDQYKMSLYNFVQNISKIIREAKTNRL